MSICHLKSRSLISTSKCEVLWWVSWRAPVRRHGCCKQNRHTFWPAPSGTPRPLPWASWRRLAGGTRAPTQLHRCGTPPETCSSRTENNRCQHIKQEPAAPMRLLLLVKEQFPPLSHLWITRPIYIHLFSGNSPSELTNCYFKLSSLSIAMTFQKKKFWMKKTSFTNVYLYLNKRPQ